MTDKRSIPDKIYLQYDGDVPVTFCEDQQHDDDVDYTRTPTKEQEECAQGNHEIIKGFFKDFIYCPFCTAKLEVEE